MLGITGATVVHAAGEGASTLWDAVENGHTALRRHDPHGGGPTCWIGVVPSLDSIALPTAQRPWDCRNHRLAWLALQDDQFRRICSQAVSRHGRQRIGIVLGTSTSGIRETEFAYAQRRASGRWPDGFGWRYSHAPEALPRFTAEVLKLEGPMATVTTACSSSAKVFLTAARWIRSGVVDAAVVGGADTLCGSTLHGFEALQLLSDEICRPFDASRKGISIGEAAGFALLERTPGVVNLVGGGESSDAWHPSTPHPEGLGAQSAMRGALTSANLEVQDIGYVNAHGTATPSNDRAEAAAIAAVFGERGVPVSSTKGATGHTLGAAGIVEAIITMEALQRQIAPPSTNLLVADPALPLDLVRTRRATRFRYAMSNNFGFGGSNCALVFGLAD